MPTDKMPKDKMPQGQNANGHNAKRTKCQGQNANVITIYASIRTL
jgi:hypothetical protein